MSEFILVTSENVEEVSQFLFAQKGAFILTTQLAQGSPTTSLDLRLELFESPTFNTERGLLYAEDRREGIFTDRSYHLCSKRRPDRLQDLFEGLTVGEAYRLEIGYQAIASCQLLLVKGMTLYVSDKTVLAQTLEYLLFHLTYAAGHPIAEESIHDMVVYMMTDLEDGNILWKNIQAGIMADNILGIR